MKKLKEPEEVSTLQVLEALSDQISIDLFNTVAKNVTTSENIIQILDITRKEYYVRSSRLLKISLIKRQDGRFSITAFGKLIYEAQLKISRAFHHSSELKMIDAVKSYAGISANELKKLIDKLIDDSEIKGLIT